MSKKLKIAMITTTFFPNVGGAEYQVKWLAEELVYRGHEVYLFTPYNADEYLEKKGGYPKNIPLRKKGAKFSDAFRMIYRFTKSIREVKPDVVHAHYAFSAGFFGVITKPLHKAPVIITSHGEDIQMNKEIGYGMRNNWIKRVLIKFVLSRCDKHVLVSNSMVQDARKAGSDKDKIQVIYNMHSPSNKEVTEQDIAKVKEKYGIPLDKRIILTVSRLHPKKGINYLIEAMEKISEEDPDVLLVIVGKGEEKENLEKLVKEKKLRDKVVFTGFVGDDEKSALIKDCDIFCLPSLREGLPIGLFDPMYYSKPIVATNVSGVFETLGETYEYIVEKADPHDLSKAVSNLLLNKEERLLVGRNLNSRLEKFSVVNIVYEYEKLYRALEERR